MSENVQMIKVSNAYISADFSSCVPDTNDLYVTSNESLTLTLLPIKNKPSIAVAWDKFG